MKKIILFVVSVVLTVGVVGVTAKPLMQNVMASHNRYDYNQNKTKKRPVEKQTSDTVTCPVSGCTQMTNHSHNDKMYDGHSNEDGHAYHNSGMPNCNKTESHHNKDGGRHH